MTENVVHTASDYASEITDRRVNARGWVIARSWIIRALDAETEVKRLTTKPEPEDTNSPQEGPE